jgi:hypothetical protein
MKNTDLTETLLRLAERYAADYGCDLDRLDQSELAYYTERVSWVNLEEMAGELAAAAWQAY